MAATVGVDKIDIKSMLPDELTTYMAGLGQPAYRARQLFSWLHARAATSYDEMTNLPRALRQRLAAEAELTVMPVLLRQQDPHDQTTKYLLQLADGNTVETVGMQYEYGTSVCVSSQVGCQQGCVFCASTIGGLVRDLTPGEMVEQVLRVQRDLPDGSRVGHVVVMGMGEPLENYDHVVKFLHLVHEPEGLNLSYRNLTVSTSGVVPRIYDLAREGIPVTLAISLHASDDEARSKLMPINRKWPLAQVLQAARDYTDITGRRVTFEYALIAGKNDGAETARRLADLLRGLNCHVNLIPLNPVAGRPLEPTSRNNIYAFQRILQEAGLAATVRRQLGLAIEAACGQLRRRHEDGEALWKPKAR